MLKTTLRGSAKIVKPQEILLLYYINVLLAYKILCSKVSNLSSKVQGGRIKMRSPPKVLTGNFRPSQLSFFLS